MLTVSSHKPANAPGNRCRRSEAEISLSRATMRISDLHFRLVRTKRRLPLWVRKRHSAMLLARSAPEGEADEIGAKADIAARTSAVGGKADVTATWPGSPLLAMSGHWASKPSNYSSTSTQSTSPRKLTVMSFRYAGVNRSGPRPDPDRASREGLQVDRPPCRH